MELSVYDLWDLMGDSRDCSISFIWLAKLVWKTFVKCIEFGVILLDVVSVKEAE